MKDEARRKAREELDRVAEKSCAEGKDGREARMGRGFSFFDMMEWEWTRGGAGEAKGTG